MIITSRLDQYKGRLTNAQIADGMTAAVRNARRLCDDAQLMLANQRFPTAAALAVLSIEESGKLAILRRLSTATDDAEVRALWQEYRSHVRKNVAWPALAVIRRGARELEDFRPLFEEGAEHPRQLESLKQLALYTDCLEDARWSRPEEVITDAVARELVSAAEALSIDRDVSTEEIDLWVAHLGPVKNGSLEAQKDGLLAWHNEMVATGLKAPTKLDVDRFFRGVDPDLADGHSS